MTIKYDCGCFLVELFNYREWSAFENFRSPARPFLFSHSVQQIPAMTMADVRSIMMTDQKQRKREKTAITQPLTRRKFQLRQIREKTVQRVCENTKLK
jgi:hypothetical protein